jgi:starch phosphorylase
MLRLASPDNPNILTIGFARRFATYKRAALLFQNLDWLRQLVSDPQRPVVFVFAGKAHPADAPGQEMIRRIAEVAAMPDFVGHILLVEGYDLHIARRLVAGVDVWLNNPIYPLEASGTSGMKAGLNGVINLSVLDGWWGESCDDAPGRENGWGIKPVNTSGELDDPHRDAEEARALYEILQDKVIPLYYERGPMGYSPGWVATAKRSIATVTPHFNSARMVGEYIGKFYTPAARQWHRHSPDNFAGARKLATWKTKVRNSWPKVAIRRIDNPRKRMPFGEKIGFEVAVNLGGLDPADVTVELLFGRPNARMGSRPPRRFRLECKGPGDAGESLFGIELTPEVCGKIEYRIRVYPSHELLTHPFELGMMIWL